MLDHWQRGELAGRFKCMPGSHPQGTQRRRAERFSSKCPRSQAPLISRALHLTNRAALAIRLQPSRLPACVLRKLYRASPPPPRAEAREGRLGGRSGSAAAAQACTCGRVNAPAAQWGCEGGPARVTHGARSLCIMHSPLSFLAAGYIRTCQRHLTERQGAVWRSLVARRGRLLRGCQIQDIQCYALVQAERRQPVCGRGAHRGSKPRELRQPTRKMYVEQASRQCSSLLLSRQYSSFDEKKRPSSISWLIHQGAVNKTLCP